MLIKYKGNTSALAADLSMELQRHVDLHAPVSVLYLFFHRALKELTLEKSIELLCPLPPGLKPFCDFSYKEPIKEHELFSSQAENLVKIYSCFPESAFPDTALLKNHWTHEVIKA